MQEVRRILNELECTPSTNDKKEIIRVNSNNKLFMKFIKYALDDGKSYGIKTLPYNKLEWYCKPEDIFQQLDNLADRVNSANSKETLTEMCNYLNCTDLIELILKKDLRCGVGARLVNDVIPKHIDIVPYERYKSMKNLNKLNFNNNIVAQLKMNGLFSYYFTSTDTYLTRNNKKYKVTGVDYDKLIEALNEDEPLVFVGEGLLIDTEGNFVDRKTSNGVVNSFIHGGSEDRHNDFVHVVWLYLTESEYYNGVSEVPYISRITNLEEAFDIVTPNRVKLVDSMPVESIEAAQKWYKSKRKLKEEGCIVKDSDNLCWSDNKSGSKFGVKMKAEAEVDVKIVSAYYGEQGKKWENLLGGIVISTEDGKIQSSVGMGFSDEERERGVEWWNAQAGKIVTIKVRDITKAKGNNTFAFESASFVETRFNEKSIADSYSKCVDELANS